MLYSIVVKFRSETDATIPSTRGYYAYALFLDLIRQANPAAAEKLHDLEGPKPLTLSPLQGKLRGEKGSIRLAADDIYWMRLTFLQEDVFANFLDAALKAGDRVLHLNQALLRIHEIQTAPGSSHMCRFETFEELVLSAGAGRQLRFEFLSPTAFRSGGKRNVLLPEPRLVFTGYFVKWQSLSPIKLPDNLLALADKGLRLTQHKMETRMLNFGSYQEAGFEGRCTIEIAEELPEEAVRSFNALASFAFYCGTGAKTTMGMGQTRRLDDVRSVPGGARGYPPQG